MSQITPAFTQVVPGHYTSEVDVPSEFIIHLEFASPAHITISRNTGGTKFAYLSSFQDTTILERTYHIGAQSKIQISVNQLPEMCVITEASSSSSSSSSSFADTPDTISTPEIDSPSELRSFLNGYTNDDTLNSVITDSTSVASSDDLNTMFNETT